jgi:hypothetical protein
MIQLCSCNARERPTMLPRSLTGVTAASGACRHGSAIVRGRTPDSTCDEPAHHCTQFQLHAAPHKNFSLRAFAIHRTP